jgi:prolipoprotein diacylglyceryltransferase
MTPILNFETIGIVLSSVMTVVGVWLILSLNKDSKNFKRNLK